MSFSNFKAKVWSHAIDTDLTEVCVFAEDTNQSYTGEIEGMGDTVRIQGVGKPTVSEKTLDGTDLTLSDPEAVEDTSVSLVVDSMFYFNYKVEDVDKAQGAGGVMSVLNREQSEEVASKIDKKIADLSKQTVGVQKYSANNTVVTKDNILEVLDTAQQMLFENNVSPSTPVSVTIPPWMFKVLKQAYEHLDTDNSGMIKNGKVATYSNMTIKMSNHVAKNASNHDLVQVKTKRAIAFAKGKPHTEAYRPEKGFSDAVKGFVLCGAKIVRPKEMVTIECSPS